MQVSWLQKQLPTQFLRMFRLFFQRAKIWEVIVKNVLIFSVSILEHWNIQHLHVQTFEANYNQGWAQGKKKTTWSEDIRRLLVKKLQYYPPPPPQKKKQKQPEFRLKTEVAYPWTIQKGNWGLEENHFWNVISIFTKHHNRIFL